jgi:hypothetical protein
MTKAPLRDSRAPSSSSRMRARSGSRPQSIRRSYAD